MDGAGNVNTYYRKITICPPADLDASRTVDGLDLAQFTEAFANGTGQADVTHDGTVTVADFSAFAEAWNGSTHP
jgi:hypothetical protein